VIKYYQSAVVVVSGQTRPTADVTVASRTNIAYLGDQSGIMAEVTQAQADAIVASGGVEKTQAEIAAIYPFPAEFAPPPNWGP
jgi:hypothetical protein